MRGRTSGTVLLAISAVASLGCASGGPPTLVASGPCRSASGCVTFNVSGPGGAEHPAGTPVLLSARGGLKQIGSTDSDGLFAAPRELLAPASGAALLFCWDARSLACTAVRLDTGDAAAYDWLNVTLPANKLIHRSQAKAAHGTPPSPER